jgi:hypothetical protein
MTNKMSNRHENKNKTSSFWKAFFAYPESSDFRRWLDTEYRIEPGMTARHDDIKLTRQQYKNIYNKELM